MPQENQEEQIQESEESADELEAEPEEPEVFIDYDSEENEIEVKMSKQDKFKEAGKYFEAEAELSGDEAWGSADENEENLDKLDIELGDEDQFDQDLLQEEVGKIHM